MKLKHPEAGLLFWNPVVPLSTIIALMEERVCSSCGWKVERDQRRCHRCGRRLVR